MEEKDFYFDIDLIHLSKPVENWFFTMPVRLTVEEIAALRKAEAEWKLTERWEQSRHNDGDDEWFIHHYCPKIHKKVRTAVKEYCMVHFDQSVVDELDQADIFIAWNDEGTVEIYLEQQLEHAQESPEHREAFLRFCRENNLQTDGHAAEQYFRQLAAQEMNTKKEL